MFNEVGESRILIGEKSPGNAFIGKNHLLIIKTSS